MKIKHYNKPTAKKIRKNKPWTGVRKPGFYFWDRYGIWSYGPFKTESKCKKAAKKYFRLTGRTNSKDK